MSATASTSAGGGPETHVSTTPGTSKLEYLSGFGSDHSSEALAGALPVGQNSPQVCPFGLYAEQVNGTAFTVPRARNQRSWLYRIRPSAVHERFVPVAHTNLVSTFGDKCIIDPNQLRWLPQAMPAALGASTDKVSPVVAGGVERTEDVDELDWIDGLSTMAGAGDPTMKSGMAIHTYACNKSMIDTCMYNSDGDFLILPQVGTLHIQTEMGFLGVEPGELVVIPRGIRFRVAVDGPSRGYVLEVFGGHFQLPDLGPIGANGLANTRDFLYPVAAFEDREIDYVVINKYGGHLFSTLMHHSPFDIVAWHGNYAPFKYDLAKFCTMNSVSFDHPDPSIYTVLTVPTDTPGVALADFVIFPPRWMVMDHSFRPPYYHRNTMSEFMGMLWGKYDAKVGFQPGGASLHSCMTSHGPDTETFLKASAAELKPEHFGAGLAFMFETTLMLRLTPWAMDAPHRDLDYQKCWQKLPRVFNPATRVMKALTLQPHPVDGATHGVARGTVTGKGESAALHSGSSSSGVGAPVGGDDDGVAVAPAAKRRGVASDVDGSAVSSKAGASASATSTTAKGKSSAAAGAGDKRKRGT